MNVGHGLGAEDADGHGARDGEGHFWEMGTDLELVLIRGLGW